MSTFVKRMFVSVAMLLALVALSMVFQLHLFAENNTNAEYGGYSVGEMPTNLIIQAAEQNRDAKIIEIDEMLEDIWFLDRRHRFGCCYKNPNCIDCGITPAEFDEEYSKAWLELHPRQKGFGLEPTIIENLIRNLSDLVWEELIFPYANICVCIASSAFVLIVVRRARSKRYKRLSSATLGLALCVSLFLVGLISGPFFDCKTIALLRTKLWLQERFPVFAPNSGYY